jgi:3-carboxy-cis,cis-muconate cycloisomerase
MSSVFDDFLHAPEVLESFGAQRFVAAMLQVEAALALAQAQCGLIPTEASVSIAGTCRVELFDAPKIVRDSASAGSLALPLVKSLRETVGLFNPSAVPYVHYGCTKQDLVDTTMALMTRQVLNVVRAYVLACVDALESHSELEDAAVPLRRVLSRLEASAETALAVQLGGTLEKMADHAIAVQTHMAKALGLAVPQNPWDTKRDVWIGLGCDVALLVGGLGTLASELMQDSIGAEPDAACQIALAMARRAPHRAAGLLGSMPHAHERGLGFWQADQSDWTQLLMSAHASSWGMSHMLQKIKYPAQA